MKNKKTNFGNVIISSYEDKDFKKTVTNDKNNLYNII